MEVNTVCVSTERYEELVKGEALACRLSNKLADTILPLAEYSKICKWFETHSWYRESYEKWLVESAEKAERKLPEPAGFPCYCPKASDVD